MKILAYSYQDLLASNKSFGGKIDFLLYLKKKGLFELPMGFFVEIDGRKSINNYLSYFKKYIKTEYYIVRSCSNVEDSRIASFAGLFTSKIVASHKKIPEVIKQIIINTDFESIQLYMDRLRIKGEVKLNFIVQEYIYGDFSGVYFSNFYNGEYIEYVYGPNSVLVEGVVSASSISFFHGKEKITLRNQEFFIDINGKKILYGNAPLIKIETRKKLINTLRIVKKNFPFDVDIEWTIRNSQVYILQVRPITC